MDYSQLKRFFVGNPLSTERLEDEKIPKWKALAVLSSDALSSVAYATEEILIPLASFAIAATMWSIPIALAISLLITIVTISYRQTIDCYPMGGGAYTVAKENLGTQTGLVAAAALLIDYVLTVAVSVAAGVENIASAFPILYTHKELIGVIVIIILMFLNLRGVKEAATIFALPTYFFIFSFLIMIVVGTYKLLNGVQLPAHPLVSETYKVVPVLFILRAFSSGCSALTGIEAISNGIPMFRTPSQKNAKTTLLWMSSILAVLFLGLTILAHQFGIQPQEKETVVSLLSRAIFGQNWFYYLIQFSTALILVLAANTSYSGFPRLSSLLAKDGYLPRQLASLGDRLVFSNGILGLSFASMFLIILFRGETHYLIPLYAVGVFLSFTLSQMGMVRYHIKTKHKGWWISLCINFVGSMTTLLVLLVIGYTKFSHGAWIVIILIPLLVLFFQRVKAHYIYTAKKLSRFNERNQYHLVQARHIAIIPISGIHQGVYDSLVYANSISKEIKVCCVDIDPEKTHRLQVDWKKKFPQIELVVLETPFRSIIKPILEYIEGVQKSVDHDVVTVIIPEFVTKKWYHAFLHNQTALFLNTALRLKKNIIVTSVRYHL